MEQVDEVSGNRFALSVARRLPTTPTATHTSPAEKENTEVMGERANTKEKTQQKQCRDIKLLR